MNPSTQKILYTIDRSVRVVSGILGWLCLLFLVLAAFSKLCLYLMFATFILLVIGIVIMLALSPFVKSEEEEELEKQVDYILKKKSEIVTKDSSPLRDVSPAQEETIRRVLRELPEHAEKSGYINLALVAQYLTALEKLGKADLKNKRTLRTWVAEVTGKQVPSSSQFNEALPSTAMTKVTKARKEWEALLSDSSQVVR